MTTIANSIFLVSTHPLFAVVFSILFLREYPGLKTIPAFLLAIFGMYLIVSQDARSGNVYIIGDLLAVISAISFAAYLLIARLHRTQHDFIGYLVIVYGTAAVVCALFSLSQGDKFTGYPGISWFMMGLLALGPHLSGHSILNWCSRQIAVFKVNLALLLEPVVATIGGILIFSELPQPLFYAGAGCILAALLYLFYQEYRSDQKIST
jgi:drug/metabolite transporter (DMT)-like permease